MVQPESIISLIDEVVPSLDRDLIDVRRAIHRHPELAGSEVRTAALVADQLRAAGLEVSTGVGGHGVVGILDCAEPGATIGYRADMDAVAMDEASESEFRSQVDGAGHLCGHDIHTAIGIGVARTLARVRDQLSGRVVFYFQPAEEALTGAKAMLDARVLELAEPDEIYALHCAHIPVGTFAVMPGGGLPGHDNFDLELSGPEAADKAEEIAARIASWSTVRPPATPEQHEQLLADLLVEDGPLARFVFAGAWISRDETRAQVTTHGWIKAWPDESYPGIRERVMDLVQDVCGAEGLNHLTFREAPFPAMVCSVDLSESAAQYFRGAFGADAATVLHAPFPFNGEDFAYFLNRVRGAMFFVGVANPAAGLSGIVHTPTFAADERAIALGVRAMAGWLATRLYVLAD